MPFGNKTTVCFLLSLYRSGLSNRIKMAFSNIGITLYFHGNEQITRLEVRTEFEISCSAHSTIFTERFMSIKERLVICKLYVLQNLVHIFTSFDFWGDELFDWNKHAGQKLIHSILGFEAHVALIIKFEKNNIAEERIAIEVAQSIINFK